MDLSEIQASYSGNSVIDRIRRSPRWNNDEGVASTIGTIMSLLVFLTFMGMFTNQFVPVWMSDNESTHMATVIQQMITLKSQIDGLVADYSNSLLAPTPIFVPITLHASGIPIFAEPTAGILRFSPQSTNGYPSFNATFAGDEQTLSTADDGHTGGYVDLYAPNRYFIEQHLTYDCGALILSQPDGEYIIAGLQFSVTNIVTGADTSRVVKLSQVSMLGLNKTIGGTGTKGIYADLLYANTNVYESTVGADLTLTIVSKHGNAWLTYFNKALNNSMAGLTYGADFEMGPLTLHDQMGTQFDYYTLTVTIKDVNVLDHTRATVQVTLGEVAP